MQERSEKAENKERQVEKSEVDLIQPVTDELLFITCPDIVILCIVLFLIPVCAVYE